MDDAQLFRRQVRWQMRRGLLELDLLMRRFIAEDFDALGDGEVQDLAQVLTWNDQQLLAVLQEREENPEPQLAAILAKIRRSTPTQRAG